MAAFLSTGEEVPRASRSGVCFTLGLGKPVFPSSLVISRRPIKWLQERCCGLQSHGPFGDGMHRHPAEISLLFAVAVPVHPGFHEAEQPPTGSSILLHLLLLQGVLPGLSQRGCHSLPTLGSCRALFPLALGLERRSECCLPINPVSPSAVASCVGLPRMLPGGGPVSPLLWPGRLAAVGILLTT